MACTALQSMSNMKNITFVTESSLVYLYLNIIMSASTVSSYMEKVPRNVVQVCTIVNIITIITMIIIIIIIKVSYVSDIVGVGTSSVIILS